MRPTEFSVDTIIALLRKQTIATLPEVMVALGPRASRRTAFRKLKDLDARTSYSHRGSYYTLDTLADFDEHGLWSFAGVRFSRAGTLIATAESFVNRAEAGHFVDELDNLLAVGTQDPLHKLVRDGRLTRHKLAGQFLYCAADRAHQTHQLRARRLLLATPGLVRPLPKADLMPEELRAAIVLFASLLDERQRRLFAGLEVSTVIQNSPTRGHRKFPHPWFESIDDRSACGGCGQAVCGLSKALWSRLRVHIAGSVHRLPSLTLPLWSA